MLIPNSSFLPPKVGRPVGLAPHTTVFTEPDAALTSWSPSKIGSGYRCCPGLISFTRRVHTLLCQAGTKWRPRMDLRHQPPESESGALPLSYRAKRNFAPARTCTSNLRLRRAACRALTLRELKLVAAFGIAPNSPRLQRGANLSQLHSRGSSARYRAAVDRLSADCSAFELQRNKGRPTR